MATTTTTTRPGSNTNARLLSKSAPLPPELIQAAVSRLAWLAGFFMFTFVVMFLIYHPHTKELLPIRDFFRGLLVAALVLGSLMLGAIRVGHFTPEALLDIGLVFEVFAGFLISLADSRMPFPADSLIQGQAAVTTWITFFTLTIPAPLGKSLISTFATVAMAPAALFYNVAVNGVPMMPTSQLLMFYTPTLILAVAAVMLSRYIYDLGRELIVEKQLGGYLLIERIGQGGMGEVWRARHRVLVRDAAVKLIRPEAFGSTGSADSKQMERRFELEAKSTAALQSPHTVAVFDYGKAENGSFYYVMELLDGLDLEDFVTRFGPLPAERVAHVLRQACDSLAEAHQAGLTHRDIKPRNLFLCRLGLNFDYVKVLDFGLVKASKLDETRLTREGVAAGTPSYMAPEMALGNDVDGRADLYALGCTAYWMLTGRLVFEANNALAMVMEHVQGKPLRPSQKTEMEIPAELEDLVMQLLEKDPAARPQTAREVSRRIAAMPIPAWTSDKAEEWWRTHSPTRSKPGRAATETVAASGR